MKNFSISINLNVQVSNDSQIALLEDGLKQFADILSQCGRSPELQDELTHNKTDYLLVNYLREQLLKDKVSEGTFKNRKSTIDWVERLFPHLCINKLNTEFIHDLSEHLEHFNLSANTIAKHIAHLRLYLFRAARAKLIGSEWLDGGLYSRKRQPYKHSYLSTEELLLFENASPYLCGKKASIVIRAFLFCCYSGLRFSDVIRLTEQHVEEIDKQLWIRIEMKKTKNLIQIPVSSLFAQKGEVILRDRLKNISSVGSRLFPVNDCSYANMILKKFAVRVGITKRVSFHTSRHTFATQCLLHEVRMEVIQALLGHQNIRTTQVYAEMNNQTLVKALQNIHW